MFSLLSIKNTSLYYIGNSSWKLLDKRISQEFLATSIYIFLNNVTDLLPRLRLTEKRFSDILNLGTGVLCTVEFH